MALALVVVVTLLPLVALATFTPWPLEIGILLVGGAAGAAALLVTGDAFLSTSVSLAVAGALFVLRTTGEVYRGLAADRRRFERRRSRQDRRPPVEPAGEQWWVAAGRARDAA